MPYSELERSRMYEGLRTPNIVDTYLDIIGSGEGHNQAEVFLDAVTSLSDHPHVKDALKDDIVRETLRRVTSLKIESSELVALAEA